MPWDASTFASRHNHALHGERAGHAARIANAALRSGVPEGESIAIANKWAQRHDSGGHVTRERAGEILSRGRGQDPHTDINLTPPPELGERPGPLDTREEPGWIPQFMRPDTTDPRPPGMHRAATGGPIGYDGGGMVDPNAGSVAINPPMLGGMTPSAATESPMMAQMTQRYQKMTPEKLQEMSMMAGNSPQGQIIKRMLMQKRMMPQVQQQPTQVSVSSQAMGGPVQHREGGGMLGMGLSQAEPWWTRAEARSADAGPMTGYLHGATAGRADNLKGTALSDSYILPAEEIAGLGEGNSLMGARVIQSMLNTGPRGIPQARGHAGRGLPHPPSMHEPSAFQAKGGGVQRDDKPTTDVALSHGEYSLTPEEVMRLTGRKTLASAHRVLDLFTMELRKRHIRELKGLEPPVGSKNA